MFRLPIIAKYPAVVFDKTSECMLLLKEHGVVSAASDNGSLTVWLYDDTHDNQRPVYRANRCAWMVERDAIETSNLSELRSFVAKNLKLI